VKGPDALPVRADPTRLKQVLNNLLSNAIKYSPQGGPIEVRLRSNAPDETAMIYVRDHGIGIDPEDVPRLFDRFSRIQRKETVAIPGSGLGLYIAHHIVEAHGGRLNLQPAPGKGTIAEFTVPLIQHEGDAVEADEPELVEITAGATRRRARSAGENGTAALPQGDEHVVLSADGHSGSNGNGRAARSRNGRNGHDKTGSGEESIEGSPIAQEDEEEASTK
jgi:hypothetical protein